MVEARALGRIVVERLGSTVLLGAGLGLLLACGDSRIPAEVATVRDSAGVRVVETHRPLWSPGEGWELDPEPILQLGSDFGGGMEEFQEVRGLAFTASGELVVLDAGRRVLRWIDEKGTLLREVELFGNGPEELLRPRLLGLQGGDAPALWDDALHRLVVVSRNGSPTPVDGEGLERRPPPVPWGIFPDGALLTILPEAAPPWPPDGSVVTDTMKLWRLEALEGEEALLVERPGRKWLVDGGQMWPVPFTLSPLVAPHRNGVVVAAGPDAEVDFLDGTGRLQIRARLGLTRREITAQDRERYQELLLASASSEREREAAVRRLEAMPAESHLPAFDQIITSREGHVLLRHTLLDPGHESVWSVLDADGHLLGEIRTPRRFQLFHVAGDRMVGIGWNALRLETIRVYRIRKDGR